MSLTDDISTKEKELQNLKQMLVDAEKQRDEAKQKMDEAQRTLQGAAQSSSWF